jgi:hypothetical protein
VVARTERERERPFLGRPPAKKIEEHASEIAGEGALLRERGVIILYL